MDANTFNTDLSKQLKILKKNAGASNIRQNYKGTGSRKYRRQLYVRFNSGAVIDLWLEDDHIGLGGVVKNRASDNAAELPRSVAYNGRQPSEVAQEVAQLLKAWAV